jgi:hypothetical protein
VQQVKVEEICLGVPVPSGKAAQSPKEINVVGLGIDLSTAKTPLLDISRVACCI